MIPMSPLDTLTQREGEILSLVSDGKQNKEIALALGIAVHTVEQHLKHIYQKLGIGNRTEAAVLYWKQNAEFPYSGNPLYTAG
jgi:DNA-binding CsgD family transcriptional regulator